ncbi:MAG: phosphate acyltransferase [Pseudomonadota bacterium]
MTSAQNPLDAILAAVRDAPRRRIVLSEGEDPRVAAAALRAKRDGLAEPILLGDAAAVANQLAAAGAQDGEVDIVDPKTDTRNAAYADAFHQLRKHKGVDAAAAAAAIASPLAFAAMMVRLGDAEGTVGGAVATTADTVRAALQIIGRASGVKTVSSFFLMGVDAARHGRDGTVVFADCGLVVAPNPDELSEIAISSADSYRALTGETPQIAMLSFSTKGSAGGERVAAVAEATAKIRAARPDLAVDGELQFDAALVASVAEKKARRTCRRGRRRWRRPP